MDTFCALAGAIIQNYGKIHLTKIKNTYIATKSFIFNIIYPIYIFI